MLSTVRGVNRLLCNTVKANLLVKNVRYRHSRPMNTVIVFVPQQEAWIVERMGKFNKILDPGLNLPYNEKDE